MAAVRFALSPAVDTWGNDVHIFWNAGRLLAAGENPYEPAFAEQYPFLNPPSAFLLFRLLAGLGFDTARSGLAAINVALCCCLVPLSRAAFGDAEWRQGRGPWTHTLALSLVVALSDAALGCVILGQLPALATAAVLLGLAFHRRHRAVLAGACLAVATVKAGTLAPFALLLLGSPTGRRTVVWLAVFAALLVAAGGRGSEFLSDCRAMLGQVNRLSAMGEVNDFSRVNATGETMIGLDHLLDRLGVFDRRGVIVASTALIVALTGGATVWMTRSGRIGEDAQIALTAMLSMLFFYHRLYDSLILAPAVMYCFVRAQQKAARGGGGHLYLFAFLALLSILYLRSPVLRRLTDYCRDNQHFVATAVRIVVLPYGTWMLLAAMGVFVVAETRPTPVRETP